MGLLTVVKKLTKFSIPIIFGQLGMMLIGVGDVFVAAKYSTTAVAAIGVANGVINPIFLFGIGMMIGVSPVVAIRRGEGKEIKHLLPTSLFYAFINAAVLVILTLVLNLFVPYLGFKPELVPHIQEYVSIVVWSFFPAYFFQVVKEFLQSFEKVVLANTISMATVFVNLVVNYLFVFGHGSFEGMGIKGLAYASLVVRILMSLSLIILSWKYLKKWILEISYIKRMFSFSLPVAFMFFLEVLAFCMVAILVGRISVEEAATNNIIMQLASLTFMIPLSLSHAASVKVGAGFGSKDIETIKNYTNAALLLAIGFMSFTGLIFWFFPEGLMSLVSNDVSVVKLGVSLLGVVAIFQLSDGVQAVLSGVLRGLDKTKESTIVVFIGYWIIGIPLGYYLAFVRNLASLGLWIGLGIALFVVALSLFIYTKKVLPKIQLSFASNKQEA